MPEQGHISDREFVAKLRAAVDAYLASVDRWEAAKGSLLQRIVSFFY